MCGAATFQIGITVQLGPPAGTPIGSGSALKASLSAAFTYMGSGLIALPAAATASIYCAVYQAENAVSAVLPNTCRQVPPARPSVLTSAAGTGPSNRAVASGV